LTLTFLRVFENFFSCFFYSFSPLQEPKPQSSERVSGASNPGSQPRGGRRRWQEAKLGHSINQMWGEKRRGSTTFSVAGQGYRETRSLTKQHELLACKKQRCRSSAVLRQE